MAEVVELVDAPIERVFAVLADGWSYAGWVVGASHIRDVDPDWPKPGARIHHSVGPWPLVVSDTTEVVSASRPREMELDARMWPLGSARIRFRLTDKGAGVTEVRMAEQVLSGPGSLVPDAVQDLLLVPRNRETLQRLADLARGRGDS
ncbi:SRPBCC family protein [Lentzea tibetensis]|uniref:SRPBCC family protein n=1 Tax=Lentzea tibetensis TaxID=2591470 RepID=A0A563EX18_9PSEU|nr:SRPBCC family protein [Lentzea tibetensis]TWP52088.1 SRPBCC family protein [Lentzea tibetensis]